MRDILLHRLTAADLRSTEKLSSQHQALARVLQDAEQQSILQAYLVMITYKQDCTELLQEGDEYPEYNSAITYITDWRSLSGQDPGLEYAMDCDGYDKILQVQYTYMIAVQLIAFECCLQAALCERHPST